MFHSLIRQIRASDFLKHNAILFFGSVAVGVLNYAYYPILGRILDVQAYGEVQALVSLFLQLTIFLTVLSQVTVNVVANYDDENQQRRIVYELEKVAFMLSLALLLIVVCMAWWLRTFFRFDSAWPFIILMTALVTAVPLTFRSAFLRGHKKFGASSVAQVIASVTKILFSVALVMAGFGTAGAVGGIVVAQVLAFGYAAYIAKQLGFMRPLGVRHASLPDLKAVAPELRYGAFVLCGSLAITLLSSVDVFVVKHFFDAQTAGRYAGVSTVARMIYFLTASVAQVLLPSVRMHQPARENRAFLIKSLILVGASGGVVLAAFALFSHPIVVGFMGRDYGTYAHLLPPLSLAMFVLSVLNLLIAYYMALRRYKVTIPIIAGVVATGILLGLWHASLDAVVRSLMFGSISMLVILGLWRGFYHYVRKAAP